MTDTYVDTQEIGTIVNLIEALNGFGTAVNFHVAVSDSNGDTLGVISRHESGDYVWVLGND